MPLCAWSQDVCSTEPPRVSRGNEIQNSGAGGGRPQLITKRRRPTRRWPSAIGGFRPPDRARPIALRSRSEERRGGKECRSRRSPDHLKKKKRSTAVSA